MSSNKQDKLYYHQSLLFIIIFKIMMALTYMPSLNIPPANQDVWIVNLVSIPYTIALALPLLYLSNKFKHCLIDTSEIIMGKFIGKIIGIYYSLFFFTHLVFFTSIFVEILNSSLYDETPTIVNVLILMVTCAYIANKGIMNLARLGEITIPFIIILFFILALLGFKNYNFQIFLPILKDSKLADINKGAIISSLRYIDILIITMLIPYLDDKKVVNKLFLKALIYSMIIVVISVIVVQATLGIEYAKRVNFPYYNFARLITIGDTQGFDLLYVISWIIGKVIKVSGYMYFTTIAISKVTKKNNKYFIIPVAIVTLIAVVWIKDTRPVIAVTDPFRQFMNLLSVISILIIPTIILIVYFFRRKSINKANDLHNKQS